MRFVQDRRCGALTLAGTRARGDRLQLPVARQNPCTADVQARYRLRCGALPEHRQHKRHGVVGLRLRHRGQLDVRRRVRLSYRFARGVEPVEDNITGQFAATQSGSQRGLAAALGQDDLTTPIKPFSGLVDRVPPGDDAGLCVRPAPRVARARAVGLREVLLGPGEDVPAEGRDVVGVGHADRETVGGEGRAHSSPLGNCDDRTGWWVGWLHGIGGAGVSAHRRGSATSALPLVRVGIRLHRLPKR
jgi:hypothetical protein